MNSTHPFIKYGIAVSLVQSNIDDPSLITKDRLKEEIERGINHFRIKPEGDFKDKKNIKFSYTDELKGNTPNGIYLAPNILSSDRDATDIPKALNDLILALKSDRIKKEDIKRSITPVSGEFTNFGTKSIGRGKPKTDIFTACFCAITTTTPSKPSMSFKTWANGEKGLSPKYENIAIIPDLEIAELVDFINLFEKLRQSATENLSAGWIDNKGKPQRPKFYSGNFPNAPRSSALGSVALLGAIGNWGKEAKQVDWAKRVLESLESRPMYLIGNKTFETFQYNHYIIDLAKERKLSSIIDSIYYTVLYNKGSRKSSPKKELDNRIEYQKFDLFASRFLQLFNRPAFKDFLAFRAEYPNQLESLFKTYFINMEKVNEKTVQSARALGKWLNYAAYKVAQFETADKGKEELRNAKAKVLIEIESSIFSARSGDALIFQAVTRAGRHSKSDAPSEAELFMTQAATGEISLDTAKHLLIAFSRVMNKIERKENPPDIAVEIENDESETSSEDISDAQE